MRAHPDSVAARTLTTPLTLSLARDTYSGDSDDENPKRLLDPHVQHTPEALHRHLLARLLHRAYPKQAEREYNARWLAWIAHHLGTNRDLRWWDVPFWTPRPNLTLGVVFGLAFGLAVGLIAGLTTALEYGLRGQLTDALNLLVLTPILGLLFGLVSVLVFGSLGLAFVTVNLAPRTRVPQALSLRPPDGREWLHIVGGLAIGIAAWLIFGLLNRLDGGKMLTPMFAPWFGLVGLIFALFTVWSTPVASSHAATPMTVYRADLRRTAVLGLTLGLTGGLGMGLALTQEPGIEAWLAVLVFGLLTALVAGLGPTTWLRMAQFSWTIMRRPVRFMPLLETALQRQVLRQAGSVYQFRHAALQDYLADLHASSGARTHSRAGGRRRR